jgi:hypothetical protein
LEKYLLENFDSVRPFTAEEARKGTINRYKDGSYGVSNIGFALYSNGNNPRGRSSNHPFGLVFEDGENLFSIGYYRKESDPEDSNGYIFVVSPRGRNATKKIMEFTDIAISDDKIPCKGVYARFLTREQYDELLHKGFLPVDESHNPWHTSASREDETFSHSLITLDNAIKGNEKLRLASNRFDNFSKRNGLRYYLRQYRGEEDYEIAKIIVKKHFDMLRKAGKQVDSVPEDHYNSIDAKITRLDSTIAHLGFLDNVPVSLFVGEKLSDKRVALYTPFTLRDTMFVFKELGLNPNETLTGKKERKRGFTAMPAAAYLTIFEDLKARDFDEVLLGGSELKGLDDMKRKMGAKPDPSYWAVKLR